MKVVRLRGEGWSVRAIAAEVFGEARYRGRVERILARRGDQLVPAGEVDVCGLDGLCGRVCQVRRRRRRKPARRRRASAQAASAGRSLGSVSPV